MGLTVVSKIFILAAMVLFFAPQAAFADRYAAMAGGIYGFAYDEGRTMEEARYRAVQLCRNMGYGSCSVSVAERSYWYYSGGVCNGTPYIGASPQGVWRSDQIVYIKGAADGNYDCTILFRK